MKKKYHLKDPAIFKIKALYWASLFDTACFLDSNGYADPYAAFDVLIAAEQKDELNAGVGHAFEQLHQFLIRHQPNFVLGYLSYDLKNEIENLESNNSDGLKFPDLYFFVPRYLLIIQNNEVQIEAEEPDYLWYTINKIEIPTASNSYFAKKIHPKLSYDEYKKIFLQLKKHINRGDIYEINLCQEFFADHVDIPPVEAFIRLNEASPMPFASFFKQANHYTFSATPERFLCRRAHKLISQPIKGTIKRGQDAMQDNLVKYQLRNDPKELSENVMIVDVVRNDFSKSAKRGTVQVEELFGIYSFKQVHQMISTVVCQAIDGLSNTAIIRNTFPMGSMTGAPKIRAMELIEQYELSKRGVYSGALGYFSPNGDFDFNVIIRTILYNANTKYLSFQVGSAITQDADAKQEYEECMLKAQAMIAILTN